MVSNLTLSASDNTYITDLSPDKNFHPAKIGYCGKDRNNHIFRYLIKFDMKQIPENVVVDSAVLSLYADSGCKDGCFGFFKPYMLDSEWKENSVTWRNAPGLIPEPSGSIVKVADSRWYRWNITKIVCQWLSGNALNHGIIIKSDENDMNIMKSFYTSHCLYDCKPYLELGLSAPEVQTANLCSNYPAKSELAYSHWFNTSLYSMYTIFIFNTGENPVEAFIQISPDRSIIVDEKAVYRLDSGQSEAVVPLKYGYFTRIAFRSYLSSRDSNIKIIFQARV